MHPIFSVGANLIRHESRSVHKASMRPGPSLGPDALSAYCGVQRVGTVVPLPAAPGVEPAPASLAPVLFDIPDRLVLPVVGPLPAEPGDDPEPASFAPVLFNVPERVVPEPVAEPPSAA